MRFQYISCYGLSGRFKKKLIKDLCFNTSHVTVYRTKDISIKRMYTKFQYISCYGLSTRGQWRSVESNNVSIHLMLRFILAFYVQSQVCNMVSIHLMLRFIFPACFLSGILYIVSIHLMLRFIFVKFFWSLSTFARFNTSHVTVYHFFSFLCVFVKFRFNTSHVTVYLQIHEHNATIDCCFNTSHVTVYRC